MRLVCLVFGFFHRQACLLGSQTTNRIFNYAADIPSGRLATIYTISISGNRNIIFPLPVK